MKEGQIIIINKDNKSHYKVVGYRIENNLHLVTAFDIAPNALDKFNHTFSFTDLEYKNIKIVA